MSSTIKNVQEFSNSLKNLTFQEKYKEWIKQITILEESKDNIIDVYYKEFLESYPFNHTYWNKYAQYVSINFGKDEGLKIYQKAVEMNPRSLDLWNCYCSWVNFTYSTQIDLIGLVYEKAVEQIGFDFNSYIIWDAYLNFEIQKNVEKAHTVFFNVIKYPINKLENYSLRFKEFLNSLSELDIINIYHKFYPKFENETQDLKGVMIKVFENEIKKTLLEIKDRKNFENQLKKTEYDDQSNKENQIWMEYIEHEKQFNKKDRTIFVYEKALITQNGNTHLWMEYFENLEELYENATLLILFQKYKSFFKSLDMNILYYWTDFLENVDVEKARLLFLELQKENGALKSYVRHCQLEIRNKNFPGAKKIYESMLLIFADQPEISSFILFEYCDFLKTYFNDISSLHNHFQGYFDKNAFSKYFLSAYFKFLKEVFAENEHELNTYISSISVKALKKSNEISKNDLEECYKLIINFTRGNFTAIQEIKSFVRKIKNLYKNLLKSKEENQESETLLKKRNLSDLDGKENSLLYVPPTKQIKTENI